MSRIAFLSVQSIFHESCRHALDAGDEGVEMLPPGWKWDSFHSSVQVTELFMSLQKRCPSGLVTIYNAGFSQEGRSLKVLQVRRADRALSSPKPLVGEAEKKYE